ncbi:FAD-dependent monooxygenase [Neolewinella persica]|uniref:FAD-dependent monooxygenase n=1 Tax=Neolewinella persica TaxID=70998 RepID=UPI00036BE72C|nr:FAD-dependent monooxygenase [Neolewinella persica]
MLTQQSTQVIVVGAGPTGLSLACMLRHYGVDVVLIEKVREPVSYSKAMVIHARSMEAFDEIGLADEIISQGQVMERINIMTNGQISEVVELTEFGRGLTKFPYVLNIEQEKTEAILINYLDRHGVTVNRGEELLTVKNGADRVTVTCRDEEGKISTLTADYLVGCDGARSTVRQQLGLTYEGKTEAKTFYVADVRIQSDLINKKEGYLNLTAKGFVLLFGLEGDRHYRIVGLLPDDQQNKETTTFADVREFIGGQLKTPVKFEEEMGFFTYKVHRRIASKFYDGRCFLAGGASHIHTPAGGLGMNSGIHEANNLAWKLSFALQEKGQPELLESYNQERMAVARQLLATSDLEFDFMTGEQPWLGFLKLNVFPFFVKMLTTTRLGNKQAFSSLAQLSISYPDSPLTEPGRLAAVSAGDRLPYFITPSGNSVFDEIRSDDYKLLWFGPAALLEQFDLSSVTQKPIVFEKLQDVFGGEFEFFVVLRPDNHIAYLGDDLEKVLEQLRVG